MQTKRIVTIVTVVATLTLLLAASSTVAGLPVEGGKTSGKITLAGTVASKISYQGRLTDAGGNPLNDNYNLVFQLWDDATAGSQVGVDIVRNNVAVSNGLFTVDLDVPQDAFNGQALWLRVQVSGQWLSPRQELLPVPYALSLKPGATIYNSTGVGVKGRSDDDDGVVGWTGASDKSGVFGNSQVGTGVAGRSEAASGYGLAGTATAENGRGVYGSAGGSDGVGVYGRSDLGRGVEGRTTSDDEWVSAIYGKNVGAGDGVYGWSQNRHGTYGVTSSQDADHAGVYGVNHGAGPAIKADGDLVVKGAYRGDIGPNGGAPFPRPAYDSGWQSIAQGETRPFPHGIGGNPDNYVVDLQFQDQAGGRHQLGYGGETYLSHIGIGYFNLDDEGAFWHSLNDQQIMVTRMDNDTYIAKVRVRIWVYK